MLLRVRRERDVGRGKIEEEKRGGEHTNLSTE
jgi:hypothetical protein